MIKRINIYNLENMLVNFLWQNESKYKILITVKDTGIEIPENKIDTIFDRFIQVDKSFTRNLEGSGIGLSIVKAFVEMLNGTISVESKYVEGSTFMVTLPANLVEEGTSTVQKYIDEKMYKG